MINISEIRSLLQGLYPTEIPLKEDVFFAKKIIKEFSAANRFFDEPFLFRFYSKISHASKSFDTSSDYATGTSFLEHRAKLKCIGEAVERFCLAGSLGRKMIQKSFKSIKSQAIPFSDLIKFSDRQLTQPRFKKWIATPDSNIKWIECTNLLTRKKIFFPAQMVFVPYNLSRERIIQLPISTGAAAHRTLAQAITNGILEVIERDAFITHYLLNTGGVKIIIKNQIILKKIDHYLRQYRLELHLFSLPTDIQVHNIMAIVIDKTGKGPVISAGVKSGFDPLLVCIGAIEEALQSRPWMRNEFAKSKGNITNSSISTIVSRGFYWYSRDRSSCLSLWTRNRRKRTVVFSRMKNYNLLLKKKHITEYAYLLSDLKHRGHSPYFIDLSSSFSRKIGLRVVKCLIPTLHPLHLDESFSYQKMDRLQNLVPILFKRDRKIKLNTTPHFFL